MANSDEMLLARWQAGDQEAFAAIFRAYYGRVCALAYRFAGSAAEAEDIAQETFLRLYRRPPAGPAPNLLGWLLKVAANLGYNSLRERRRRQVREERAGAPEERPARLENAALAEQVRQALLQLPERDVQLLLLRQVGLSYAELAAALGVAPGSIGTLLARAERAFRTAYGVLEENDAEPVTLP